MTLEKFNKLSVKFMDVGLRDKQAVTGVIDMIVEKAQMEPHFSRYISPRQYPNPENVQRRRVFSITGLDVSGDGGSLVARFHAYICV